MLSLILSSFISNIAHLSHIPQRTSNTSAELKLDQEGMSYWAKENAQAKKGEDVMHYFLRLFLNYELISPKSNKSKLKV